jgi:hypothetical protein
MYSVGSVMGQGSICEYLILGKIACDFSKVWKIGCLRFPFESSGQAMFEKNGRQNQSRKSHCA